MALDKKDFDHAFREYSDVLWRRALRILGNREDALEVVQEGYLRLYQRGADIDPKVHLAWLMTTTQNLALNRLRKSKRHRGYLQAVETDAEEQDPDYQDTYAHRRLLELMAEEPDALREILVAHYVDGESLTKIAQRTGQQPRTVQRNHERFIRRAKEHLEIKEDDTP